MFTRCLGTNPALIRVSVTGGQVTLAGVVENKSMIPLAVSLCRAIDGVVDAASNLSYVLDDTPLPPVPDLASS